MLLILFSLGLMFAGQQAVVSGFIVRAPPKTWARSYAPSLAKPQPSWALSPEDDGDGIIDLSAVDAGDPDGSPVGPRGAPVGPDADASAARPAGGAARRADAPDGPPRPRRAWRAHLEVAFAAPSARPDAYAKKRRASGSVLQADLADPEARALALKFGQGVWVAYPMMAMLVMTIGT